MFESIFLRIFAIPLRFLAQTGRNMIQWASGIAGQCAVRPKQRNSAAPNGEGTEKMSEQNRRLRAAGIAALAWAGLAAVWCVLVPGGAAELPQGVPGTLRSLLVLPLAEELVCRGALLRLLTGVLTVDSAFSSSVLSKETYSPPAMAMDLAT